MLAADDVQSTALGNTGGEWNVSAAAGNIGGDGDASCLSCSSDQFCFCRILTRIVGVLGIVRVSKDITPHLSDYLENRV